MLPLRFVSLSCLADLLITFLFSPLQVRADSAPAPPLSSYDWSVEAPHSLATNPPPVAAVRAFMVKAQGHDDGYQSDVCSFRFANLRRVVSVNWWKSRWHQRLASEQLTI